MAVQNTISKAELPNVRRLEGCRLSRLAGGFGPV